MQDVSTRFPQHVIARKRDGQALSRAEIDFFVEGATSGSWADYQLTAMLMAVFLRGMDAAETAALTDAMMRSGTIADLSSVRLPKVDKHSTGGVGDKLSLPLAPIVAACGVAVPMISGRGLGHTGGTLDKLEAIPGFRVGLSMDEYRSQMEKLGIALIGQTRDLAPADRKLYSLRDVTATVECIPLICASILSKKLAEGIDSLVLDVKFGRGAFMREKERARLLARTMVDVAVRVGKPTRALLTSMDQPLGRAVGNGVEVAESIACLRGEGPSDVMEVTYALGEQMLLLAGVVKTPEEARQRMQKVVSNGEALRCFARVIEAQGGNPAVTEDLSLLPAAPVSLIVEAPSEGFIVDVDPMKVALAALLLGAGRSRAEDGVDPAVGFDQLVQRGERVSKGQPLGRVLARTESAARKAAADLLAATQIGEDAPTAVSLVEELIA